MDDGQFRGHTSPAYANMVGPFGGVTAACMLQAPMKHAQRLGEPIALTVNFASALADGEFTNRRAAAPDHSLDAALVDGAQPRRRGGCERNGGLCRSSADLVSD